jgi:hypothetical protein
MKDEGWRETNDFGLGGSGHPSAYEEKDEG